MTTRNARRSISIFSLVQRDEESHSLPLVRFCLPHSFPLPSPHEAEHGGEVCSLTMRLGPLFLLFLLVNFETLQASCPRCRLFHRFQSSGSVPLIPTKLAEVLHRSSGGLRSRCGEHCGSIKEVGRCGIPGWVVSFVSSILRVS